MYEKLFKQFDGRHIQLNQKKHIIFFGIIECRANLNAFSRIKPNKKTKLIIKLFISTFTFAI